MDPTPLPRCLDFTSPLHLYPLLFTNDNLPFSSTSLPSINMIRSSFMFYDLVSP
jgi:hypothetical protein